MVRDVGVTPAILLPLPLGGGLDRVMTTPLPSDLEIASAATLRPLDEVAAELAVTPAHLEPYGRDVAKIDLAVLDEPAERHTAKYVVVTAITPTPLGEGKTTTAIGLVQALARLGKRGVVALRQPSMGPTFGIKGGAAGGGYSQVVPMERLNLHLTGDFHAVTAAHNLLSAMIDNHLHHGNVLGLDVRNITWRRVLDVNDRSLRSIVVGLGAREDGVVRETGFDITAASEVMVLLTLATSLRDLRERLGRIVIGYTTEGKSVTADDLGAAGAMAALLRDALKPNLLQTLEGGPAIVHCGPFGNIATGTSSVTADLIGMRGSDYVVTEAGFGADMGAERFFDVKCRVSGLRPDAAVIVATVRALKSHSGRWSIRPGKPLPEGLLAESPSDVQAGLPNLRRHIEIVRRFGVQPVVAINAFPQDHDSEHAVIRDFCKRLGVRSAVTRHVAEGGAGALELAEIVMEAAHEATRFEFLYPLDLPLEQKIETIATQIYGADGIDLSPAAARGLRSYERLGFGGLPVVIAKTHLSISSDPTLKGAPRGWRMPVREVRAAVGAGYVYAICGEMRTMPGLPTSPNAERIDIDEDGSITGLS
jgi:formate--tetrahydrofolate ligase